MRILYKQRKEEYNPYLLEIEAHTYEERKIIDKWHKQIVEHISKLKFIAPKTSGGTKK